MTTLNCKYTYTRGYYKGQVCGNPAIVFGFCKWCSRKRGPAAIIKKLKSDYEFEKKILGEVLINLPTLHVKAPVENSEENFGGEIESMVDFCDSDSDDEKEKFINFDEDAPGIISGAILDEVRKEEKASKNEHRIWFDGEFDSNQTKFEQMSNHLEIGVIAQTKRSALALLMLLRMEYDNYHSYVYFLAEDFVEHEELKNLDHKKVPVSKLLDIIELVRDDSYVSSFKLTEEFRVELTDGYVSKRLHEVDVWTVTRFENE